MISSGAGIVSWSETGDIIQARKPIGRLRCVILLVIQYLSRSLTCIAVNDFQDLCDATKT